MRTILEEPRSAIGYYRMRPSFKKYVKAQAAKEKISEAAMLDKIFVVYLKYTKGIR